MRFAWHWIGVALLGPGLSGCDAAQQAIGPLPDPKVDARPATGGGLQTAVLAGGCFWGVEEVFQNVRGVTGVVSGYAGGTPDTASYERVGSGNTGHAEAVRISYDPATISYGQLLKVFFSVAHDPTQLNRQGPDRGPQYRSAIFPVDAQQRAAATAYIDQLRRAGIFAQPIVTDVAAPAAFYPAEDDHQDFARRNPDHRYIVIHDQPKVEALRKQFPELYSGR
jgi:peptide-methionine (S)-S-oxide reductase